ncbi:MAG: LuxR C-terminal-related transcriptional regulator [Deltaproteobacteria bacterium]|jgi:LuxR family maltose regulon positive regulatory protein|nr:LuxR C-terminal-related transcriptional regulator [Deltaproteobacteria bacterium]
MSKTKTTDAPFDGVYFPLRLRDKLSGSLRASALVVEAPAGYGKTTLAQAWLRPSLPPEAIWLRHVGAEESPKAAWRRLGKTLAEIDPARGESLLNLGPPNEDNLGELEALLRNLECRSPTWLVLDDFHKIAPAGSPSLWTAFLEHDCPFLRLVILTRPLEPSLMPYAKSGQLRLGPEDLLLTVDEIAQGFAGLEPDRELILEIHRRTDGWPIAAALHLRHCRESGRLAPADLLGGLLRQVVWNRLDDNFQNFLLRLSPFESFGLDQAAFMTGSETLAAEAIAFLQKEAFLRFEAASGLYSPRLALWDFVRNLFAELPDKTKRETLDRAADWCAKTGRRDKAVAFCCRSRNFAKILAFDLDGLEDAAQKELPDKSFLEVLRDISALLSQKLMRRRPLSTIRLAFELFGQGGEDDFRKILGEMKDLVERNGRGGRNERDGRNERGDRNARGDRPDPEKDKLLGELRLLEAFAHFNDIGEMGRLMKEAAELTKGRAALISPQNSWTFGAPSALMLYHRQTGRLAGELEDMDFYLPYYAAMSNGHGAGGPALMRAEACYNQGDWSKAVIFGHQARHEARAKGQTSVQIGAELLFGRLALVRGNDQAFETALENIDRAIRPYGPKADRLEADLAKADLLLLKGRPDEIAGWLRQEPPSELFGRLRPQAAPFAGLCRAGYLLSTDQPEALLGEAPSALSQAEGLNFPLAQMRLKTLTAAARLRLNDRAEARSDLKKALLLAKPDKLFMPLAERRQELEPLWDELPDLPAELSAMLEQLARREPDRRKMSKAGRPMGLSSREYETARLAAEGLYSQAIAERLGVTIHTVKAHLKSAYRKTGAKNRLALHQIMRNHG